MRRSGDSYAVTARVVDSGLAQPMQVITSLVVADSNGVIVAMPSNETMALTPPPISG